MARDDLVRDPRDMTDEEEERARRAELFAGGYRAARVPAATGETLPSAPILPAGRYAGAGAAPTVPSPGAGPIAPAPGAPGAAPDILRPATGTMPRIRTPRLIEPEAPVGTQEDTLNQLQKARYRREHPMGTLGTPSGYSGIGGKILHGLAKAGEIAGEAVIPNVMATTPGTGLYERLKEGNLEQRLERQREQESQAGLRKATAQREEAEAWKAGHPPPKRLEGPEDTWTSPEGQEFHRYAFGLDQQSAWVPENENPALYDPTRTTLPGVGQQPTGAPAAPQGTIPALQFPPPTAAATPTPMAAPPVTPARPGAPGGYYGKPSAEDRRLTDAEKATMQPELARMWQAMYGTKPIDPAYTLGPNATLADYTRAVAALKSEEATAGRQETQKSREAQEAFNREEKRKNDLLQAQAAQEKKEKAAGEWVRAVEAGEPHNVHVMTRGSYDAHPHDFNPYPGNLPPTEVDKITQDAKRLNEMQGAMNAAAEAIHDYPFDQNDLVIQALQRTEQSYADKLLGIPITEYLAQNLKKLGLEGARPATREYIINLLSLREALLALPKEVTEGSRVVQTAVEALWKTLPGGETPDKDYAMRQMYRAQGIIDRVRGTTIPIVEGMRIINKLPELYKYKGNKNGQPVFSDDNKSWVDERGNPVKSGR